MNEINAATRLRSAAAQKAEADKIQVVKAAEADAEAKFLAGQGAASFPVFPLHAPATKLPSRM